MAVLESLEQRGLFRLTRLVAFVIVFFLTLTLLIGTIVFLKDFLPTQESHVSYSAISAELHPLSPTGQDSSQIWTTVDVPNADNLRLPFVLQPYLSTAQNRAVLKTHLNGLDSDEREDYLNNMAEVVQEAKNHGEDVTDVINRYIEDKSTQIELAKLDRKERVNRQLYAAGAAISTIFLIALASLVLVLLAIERNTRRSQVESPNA